jgi:hypothetical protein
MIGPRPLQCFGGNYKRYTPAVTLVLLVFPETFTEGTRLLEPLSLTATTPKAPRQRQRRVPRRRRPALRLLLSYKQLFSFVLTGCWTPPTAGPSVYKSRSGRERS